MGASHKKSNQEVFIQQSTGIILSNLQRQEKEEQKKIIESMQTEKYTLNIATLSYGICDSPFQFYHTDDLEEEGLFTKLCQIFNIIYQEQLKSRESIFSGNQFSSMIKSKDKYENIQQILTKQERQHFTQRIDKKYRKYRYSPLYSKDACLERKKFLVNKDMFKDEWKKQLKKALEKNVFQLSKPNSKIEDIEKISMDNLWKFDWTCYCILLLYIYGLDKTEKQSYGMIMNRIESIIEQQTSEEYIKVMAQEFSVKYISENAKIEKLLQNLTKNDIDIFFLQNVNEQIVKIIEQKSNQYRVASSSSISSLILVSWKCLAKVWPQGQIMPLSYYNEQHMKHNRKSLELCSPCLTIYQRHGKTSSNFGFKRQSSINKTRQQYKDNQQIKLMNVEVKEQQHIKSFTELMNQNPEDFPKAQNNPNYDLQSDKSSDSQSSSQGSSNKQQQQSKSASSSQSSEDDDQNFKIKARHLIQRKRRQNNNKKMPQSLLKKLDWHQDIFIQFFDKLIMISTELQLSEAPKMIKVLEEIKETFPEHQIIMGIDSNGCIHEQKFEIFPTRDKKQLFKKKTFLNIGHTKQSRQFSNIDNYLFSTMQLLNKQIVDINGQKVNFSEKKLIPSNQHPFDNYIIKASIQCQRPKYDLIKGAKLVYSIIAEI